MTDVRIRNVDQWVVEAIRVQAKVLGTSMEAMLRDKLGEIAKQPRQLMVEEAKTRLQKLREQYGNLPDSAPLIREDRETRG